MNDFILFYARDTEKLKYRKLWDVRVDEEILDDFPLIELSSGERLRVSELCTRDEKDYFRDVKLLSKNYPGSRLFALNPLKSGGFRRNQSHDFHFRGRTFPIGDGQCWKHTVVADSDEMPGMDRLALADRLYPLGKDVRFVRHSPTPSIKLLSNWWDNLGGASAPVYIVQTNVELVKRCLLMTTDPGDLVLDPTCGSGTTAAVAEEWGRRWITVDTSRVALALARSRLMSLRFPYYLLADSREGQAKEQEVSGNLLPEVSSNNDIRHGFVYERARTVTSGAVANNQDVEVIWNEAEATLSLLRTRLNAALGTAWEEWQVPRSPDPKWSADTTKTHAAWWEARIERQKRIDASIVRRADIEYLYDRPYEDRSRIRVAGPFTVESLSPHRVVPADEDELFAAPSASGRRRKAATPPVDFAAMVLDHLRTAGVHQTQKADSIHFTSLHPWPGEYIGAEGRFLEGEIERRAGILIGPEFGTLSRTDLVTGAREASDARFDVLIACAFNYDAHASELTKLGPLPTEVCPRC